jgi:hypothetical protein
MKNKYLKDRTVYVKEHMMQFGINNGTVDNSEVEIEDAVINAEEEEIETPEGDIEGSVIGKGIGAELEVGDNTIAVGVAVAAKPEGDSTPETLLPAAEQQPTAFTPSFETGHSYKQEWAIIKVMTNNGVRVGLDKQCETDCEVLCGNLSYQDAVLKVDEISKQSNIPAFNDDMDEYIGKVSKAYIKKPVAASNTVSTTSYKPNSANMGGFPINSTDFSTNPMGGAM